MTKQEEYTNKILDQLENLFKSENENKIDLKELEDSKNASDFFHALANLAPTVIYTTLTKNDVGTLDFNHMANRLCMINIKKD